MERILSGIMEKIGGRLEWEPIFDALWLGNIANQSIGTLPVLYKTRQFVHFEGGHAEGSTTTPSGEYARLGVGAGLNFYFTWEPLKRLSLGADYCYYWDLTGGQDDFNNFKATAAIRLDEKGHISLQATYENGLIPLSHQEVDLFTFGLGIKF